MSELLSELEPEVDEVSYAPLIEDMTWSFSRIKAFDDCPYRWYLKYIRYPEHEGKELFYASYGIYMHELLGAFNNGEKTAEQIKLEYLREFRTRVSAPAQSETVFKNYFTDGLRYLSSLHPSGNEILSVEQKAEFTLSSKQFVGYIDLVMRDDSGSLLLVDNKSKAMKPRSNRKKPTKTDIELDIYLRQLYLYSHYIFSKYGQFPDKLCFNCFRNEVFIEEQFKQEAYEEATDWFLEKVDEITNEVEFRPDMEFFKCRHLCEMQDFCDYYQLNRGR